MTQQDASIIRSGGLLLGLGGRPARYRFRGIELSCGCTSLGVSVSTSDSSKSALSIGGFYVEEGCCMSCGVPQSIAPELVAWTDEKLPSCYWIRQPETAEELSRAIKIIHTQELGCHRYSGKDPAILKRLPREECDVFHPERAFRYSRASGASETLVRLSLSASREADGVLERLWRWIVGGGSSE